MNDWYNHTRLAAYYIWEQTGCEQALDLWCCAEDIALYFEQSNILTPAAVQSMQAQGTHSGAYMHFVRNIAYRLYIYTGNPHDLANWYLAERLVNMAGFIGHLTIMAALLRTKNRVIIDALSDTVREYYAK